MTAGVVVTSRPLRLGIATDEHLGFSGSRKGGFGWATEAVAGLLRRRPEAGFEPVVLNCQRYAGVEGFPAEIDGVRQVWRGGGRMGWLRDGGGVRPDLLLCIDYRPNYRVALLQYPRVPVLVWARDPWGEVERRCLAGLRLPGGSGEAPEGVAPPDHTSFRWVWRVSRLLLRRVRVCVTSPFLRVRLASAYGVDVRDAPVLPNPIEPGVEGGRSERPRVLFLARVDPVKRPWVFCALARSFPDVDFVIAGKPHFRGPRTWEPVDVPANVRFTGHVDGEEKRRLLASSWVLVNTSIHEGLPVSVQEAFAFGVPLLSTLDPEGLASRFGVFVGVWPGDGMEALPALREGLRRLLEESAWRRRLGEEARAWLAAHHTPDLFLRRFREEAGRLVRLPPGGEL